MNELIIRGKAQNFEISRRPIARPIIDGLTDRRENRRENRTVGTHNRTIGCHFEKIGWNRKDFDMSDSIGWIASDYLFLSLREMHYEISITKIVSDRSGNGNEKSDENSAI